MIPTDFFAPHSEHPGAPTARLFRLDCFEHLIALTGDVDHVFTDPPYSDRTHGGALTNQRLAPDSAEGYTHGTGSALVDFASWDSARFHFFCELCQRTARRWTVMTCDHHHAAWVLAMGKLEVIRLGAWVKNNPTPQITGDRPGQGHEAVLIFHAKGAKRWNDGGRAAVWRTNTVDGARVPTEKPLALYRQWVDQFTDGGDTILDPCMGAGTVGIAALGRGRSFIGMEADPDRYELARERIENFCKQGNLF